MTTVIRNSPLWLTLLGLLPLSFGCASAPVLTPPAAIVPTPALKGIRIALVDFVPLPKTYPVGAKSFFPDTTGELYEEEGMVKRPGISMISADAMTSLADEEKVAVRSFVPRDHVTMLTETMLLAMKEKGMAVEYAPSVAAAKQQGAAIIIAGVVKEFKVTGQETNRFEKLFDGLRVKDLHIAGEANVRVWMVFLSGDTGARLWQGELQSMATHKRLTSNALHAERVEVLEIDESSLHPLRAILAVTAYNIAAQLVERLEQVMAFAEGTGR